MSIYRRSTGKLSSIWDLSESEDENESKTGETFDGIRNTIPKEEYEKIKAKTRQGCLCEECERAINPAIRPDFSALLKIFTSEILLRHAAIFAGTRKINEKIVDHFHTTWKHPMHMGIPSVEFVSFMMSDKKVCQRFDDYMAELLLILDDPNVKPLWHGTTVKCKFVDKPCDPGSAESCAGCNILSKGFDISKSGSANPFKRSGDQHQDSQQQNNDDDQVEQEEQQKGFKGQAKKDMRNVEGYVADREGYVIDETKLGEAMKVVREENLRQKTQKVK
ncbi:7935_t:CDS:2, partial [Acaulospora colombiana]